MKVVFYDNTKGSDIGMKLWLKCFLLIIIIIMLITSKTTYSTSFHISRKQTANIDPVKFQQLKAQIYFFKQAIDELGAISPIQVAKLWAKSEVTRNGVYQYSVSCNELKYRIINKWGEAEENFWIIGASSPWVSKYEIVKNKKINDFTYEITIKYYWGTSAGDPEPTYSTLIIIKNNKYWCVKEVKS